MLEIIILRVAVQAKSAYEWHNHVGYGMNAGLTLEEIAAIRDYPAGGAVSESEGRGAVRRGGTDRRWHDSAMPPGQCWRRHFNTQQMMHLVLTIGHYVMTSWALSAFGVRIEGGADAIGFDLRTASGKIPGKTLKPGEAEDWEDTRGY